MLKSYFRDSSDSSLKWKCKVLTETEKFSILNNIINYWKLIYSIRFYVFFIFLIYYWKIIESKHVYNIETEFKSILITNFQ